MIGERLRKLRQERGYSLSELAERAGVSKSYLSYLERDVKNNPSLQFISKIADTLNVSVEYLLADEQKNGKEEKFQGLDQEWVDLIKKLNEEMSKADLEEFRDFLAFKNWKTTKK
ncbi:helix-turn-helix domain-containing protein [Virgibacillus oceani]|uniref:Transcriptional regulator n=1 Tax=Virgibacillus oceani TaxID=1479511 RepID=A0A917M0A9_9BACI|nr:helix-turn-helix transcriptional regulator [Virgibacillus oceani]GGG69543.1 transcriptional regulator [Virgibacillus oceani]